VVVVGRGYPMSDHQVLAGLPDITSKVSDDDVRIYVFLALTYLLKGMVNVEVDCVYWNL
jgi:hypothetical protein